MNDRFVIFRTCDRPKYTELTFPRLVETTSPDTRIIVVENSKEKANWERNHATYTEFADDRCEIMIMKKRIGITRPILVGIDYYLGKYGEPDHVMIFDDDILAPYPKRDGEYWDYVLARMMYDGPWGAVGLFYHQVKDIQPVGEGLASGYPHRFMAGMCSGFRYELHKKQPLTDSGIASLNRWTSKVTDCAWFAGYPFYIQEIDKRSPDISLRHTEYADYTSYVDNLRYGKRGRR